MFWNERSRRWEKHPLCRCGHDPCYCRNLPPLDRHGRPIGDALIPRVEPARIREQPKRRRTDELQKGAVA